MSESGSDDKHKATFLSEDVNTTEPKTNRQRVEEALVDLMEADEHNNSYRYFQAAKLAERDSELSARMVGSYLPQIETDSPLDNGIIVERHTNSRGNATLWIVRQEDG